MKTPLQARIDALHEGIRQRRETRTAAVERDFSRLIERQDRETAAKVGHALRVIRHGDFSSDGYLVKTGRC